MPTRQTLQTAGGPASPINILTLSAGTFPVTSERQAVGALAVVQSPASMLSQEARRAAGVTDLGATSCLNGRVKPAGKTDGKEELLQARLRRQGQEVGGRSLLPQADVTCPSRRADTTSSRTKGAHSYPAARKGRIPRVGPGKDVWPAQGAGGWQTRIRSRPLLPHLLSFLFPLLQNQL